MYKTYFLGCGNSTMQNKVSAFDIHLKHIVKKKSSIIFQYDIYLTKIGRPWLCREQVGLKMSTGQKKQSFILEKRVLVDVLQVIQCPWFCLCLDKLMRESFFCLTSWLQSDFSDVGVQSLFIPRVRTTCPAVSFRLVYNKKAYLWVQSSFIYQ